jgi:site-specific DNA-cytosine methylase
LTRESFFRFKLAEISGASIATDKERWKALGNSMAVPVMRWIGERITKVEQHQKDHARLLEQSA